MAAPVSVIIPALDEERRIGRAVDSAFSAGAAEVIVGDGGSTDATVRVAREHGARVVTGESMRARQMNRAAADATGDILIFLHADTTLPANAAELVARSLQSHVFGGFEVRFEEAAAKLRLAAAMINLRTRITRCPWGDQAQFIRRSAFTGFKEIAIMEDYELAVRMKRVGRTAILREKVTTSGRRFLDRGLIRTAALNWRIVLGFRFGADAETLARLYRG